MSEAPLEHKKSSNVSPVPVVMPNLVSPGNKLCIITLLTVSLIL